MKSNIQQKATGFISAFEKNSGEFLKEEDRLKRDYYVNPPKLSKGIDAVVSAMPKTVQLICEVHARGLDLRTQIARSEKFLGIEIPFPTATIAEDFDLHWKSLERLQIERIEEEYWQNHNEKYLSRLSSLTSQLDISERAEIADADTIVVIPAMNEFSLHDAVSALDSSLRPTKLDRKSGSNKKTSVIIYFNYKEDEADIPDDVIDSIKKSREFNSNITVSVIQERVPTDNTVQDSKKVALDLALNLKGFGRDCTILTMDGDICEISHGLVRRCRELLYEKPWAPRVVSTNYDIPKELLKKYPAMYFYLKVLYEMLHFEEDTNWADKYYAPNQKTYGGFMLSSAKVFMSAGGIVPYRNIFEDSLFLMQMECLMNGGLNSTLFIPVIGAKAIPGAFVAATYAREIQNIIEGRPALERWGEILDTQLQNKYAGSRRADFSLIEHPLLKSLGSFAHKDEMFRLVLQSIMCIEFPNVKSTASYTPLFNAWIKIAKESGITLQHAKELWLSINPDYYKELVHAKIVSDFTGN